MDAKSETAAKPAADKSSKEAEAAHACSIWSVPTGPHSGETPALVDTGARKDLSPKYVELVGKNPKPGTVGYVMIDAGAKPPVYAANTFAV